MMGEARFGAAKNKKNVVMLTLGTGVGGAILIDGKPYQGSFNKPGHVGHMVINDEGDPDVTGMPGSLEECMGNCTIDKRSNGKFSSTRELLQATAPGDEFAKEVWLRIGKAARFRPVQPCQHFITRIDRTRRRHLRRLAITCSNPYNNTWIYTSGSREGIKQKL
jgi:hypothetical protein